MSYFKLTVLCLGLSLGASGILCAADGDIRAAGKLISDTATGQPPLVVNSTTAVSNLNADMLDGMHASDFALDGDGYFSIPLGSLRLTHNAVIDDHGRIILAPDGLSYLFTNIVIPEDYNGVNFLVRLQVYNPGANSACQATIAKIGWFLYHPGEESSDVSGTSMGCNPFNFPPFSEGDYTISYTCYLSNVQAGDSAFFGWVRLGDVLDDNCHDVYVVGIKVHYTKL